MNAFNSARINRMNNDQQLLKRCTEGEKQAWDEFIDQYAALVYHTIGRTLGVRSVGASPQVVEDLFQEFFVALFNNDFRKLRQFHGDADCSLASWLRLIATRLTIDVMRRREIRSTDGVELLWTVQSDPVSILVEREDRIRLMSLMEELPSRDRLLLGLYYSYGLKAQEIAEILGSSVPSVYTQKSRLLEKLRKMAKERDP